MKVIILTDPKKEISMKKNQLEYEIEKLYLDISLYCLTPEDLDLEDCLFFACLRVFDQKNRKKSRKRS